MINEKETAENKQTAEAPQPAPIANPFEDGKTVEETISEHPEIFDNEQQFKEASTERD